MFFFVVLKSFYANIAISAKLKNSNKLPMISGTVHVFFFLSESSARGLLFVVPAIPNIACTVSCCSTQGVKCPTFSYFLGFVLLFPTFR